jgi:hypothetical protein
LHFNSFSKISNKALKVSSSNLKFRFLGSLTNLLSLWQSIASPFNNNLPNFYSALEIDKDFGALGRFQDRFLTDTFDTYIINVSQTHYLRPNIDLYCNIVSDGASLFTVGNTVLWGAMVNTLFLILKETFSQNYNLLKIAELNGRGSTVNRALDGSTYPS